MARRVKSRSKKYHASRTWGGGNTKNRRNTGSRGGRGWAGSHKHRWTYVVKYAPDHFSSHGFSPLERVLRKRAEKQVMNVGDIYSMAVGRKIEKKNGSYSFEFQGKVLGAGDIKLPVAVRALSFSESAKKKIEAAGGSAEAIGG